MFLQGIVEQKQNKKMGARGTMMGNGGNGTGEAIGLRSGKKSVYVTESEDDDYARREER